MDAERDRDDGRKTDAGVPPSPLAAFKPHPDRAAAIGEAHARPAMPLSPPCVVLHLALATTSDADVEALHRAAFGEPQDGFVRHRMSTEAETVTKLERHTEFVSLTILSHGDAALAEAPLRRLKTEGVTGLTLLVALRAFIVKKPAAPFHPLDIGGVLRGEIEVSTSLSPGEDGFIDLQFAVGEIGPQLLGRRVQRVLEAETYRTMALIGLPMARRIGAELTALEEELSAVTDALAQTGGDDQAILDRLQDLSAQTEALRARTRFRFSASRAYAALVEERLQSFGETKRGERPTLTGFLQTRLAPAVRTIVSSETRQNELSASVGRALELLRARVDVSLDKANQDILRSMNERQYRQLVLSEAVENLSVIAISYYLLGILRYPLKSLIELGWVPLSETVALGILAPFVAVGVFVVLRLLRRRLEGGR